MPHPKNRHTYQRSGVDIDTANALVKRIGPIAKSTHNTHVLEGLGGFASLYSMPTGYKDPVLVSCTDGVGTKLKLALEHNHLATIGTDLVAMCVNDLLATGACPLFFLDYYASAKLDIERATCVIQSIAKACKQANCALIGGETAELPGMYANNDFDLAGFCVGVVERDRIMGAQRVQNGDTLIALASSGVHANGYSLVRKILQDTNEKTFKAHLGITHFAQLIEILLQPTYIYKSILDKVSQHSVHAIAHITGGGLAENLQRILPRGAHATIKHPIDSWPEIFQWIQKTGHITEQEMRRVFNCGIGMVLCVAKENTETILSAINSDGDKNMATQIGSLALGGGQEMPKVQITD